MSNAPLRYASTVILVRDGAQGVEVLLQERSGKSESFGGMFVFPGGKVDLHDADKQYEAIYSGHKDSDASAILSVPEYGLAYWMGGIRECFEEAGILLAYDKRGDIVSFNDTETKQRFTAHREALNAGESSLLDICRREELTLATDQMYYYSHWVTPVSQPRRFDTRFFVCQAPENQEPVIDNHEVVSQCWINPAEAIRRQQEEGFQIFFPTIKNLEPLCQYQNVATLLQGVAAIVEFPRILPLRKDADSMIPLIPGDEGYIHNETAETHY
ncbi:MAG: NUDIX hydrolase [Gammaproteobacteria bacterium]|nr:MAG: NUDIX hydrolase [Gammaproteobacteria bacterium]RLA48258.1 MAG: NUDIX hydrolase [Gammaproteobacteria bacterium]